MRTNNNIQALLEAIQREIIDLKTSHNIAPDVQTYYASITPTSNATITITYGDGEYDIISSVYTASDAVLGPITGNSQTLFYSGQAGQTLTVVSTRPILSITQ